MKKAIKILGWLHLLLLIFAISLILFEVALFSMFPLALIGLVGTLIWFSLAVLNLDNIIQIAFAFVAGILPYLLLFTVYFEPTFLKNGWTYIMALLLILLFKVLVVLNELSQKSQRIFGLLFTIAICPLVFGLGHPMAWNIGFGLVIITFIGAVVWPRLMKENN